MENKFKNLIKENEQIFYSLMGKYEGLKEEVKELRELVNWLVEENNRMKDIICKGVK